MFTEREKEVLGKYLSWYMVMRSAKMEDEHKNIEGIIEALKAEREQEAKDYEFRPFSFENQRYAYHFKTGNLFQINKITADVIDAMNMDKDNVVQMLKEVYQEEEILKTLDTIKSVS